MARKPGKNLMNVMLWLAVVGGAEHVAQALDMSILEALNGLLGSFAPWVQAIAGIATLSYLFYK